MGLIIERVGGRRISAERRPGQGPGLVLLHGAGGNHRSYDELLPHLAGLDVLVPALPGRAESEGPACGSMAEAAGVVAGLATACGLERAVLVGHSLGGGLAIELACTSGATVSGLVLMATGARLRVHPMILEVARAMAAGRPMPDMARGFWQRGTDPALIERVDARMAETPAAAALADWEMANAFDRLGQLGAIRAPTLILAGERDVLTPAKYAGYLHAHIPGAERVTLAGAGHLFPIEEAAATAAHIRAFLERLDADVAR